MLLKKISLIVVTAIASFICKAQPLGDTLLDVTYENGTTTSGITGIEDTHATAPDAAYIISPGLTGNYAIAHKIVYGDSAYWSDENWRSEASANQNLQARYAPGDMRRYEFSVFLKDWQVLPLDGTETSFYQLKMSGRNPVPLMIRTQRNFIDLRYGFVDSVTEFGTNKYVRIVNDLENYVNQWIHFRIDTRWTLDNTGYIKVYMKTAAQAEFVLVNEQLNYRTYVGNPAQGNVGYIKWGVYVTPQNVTRIAYHDDIRIINMNEAPTSAGLIWGNAVTDANPAYLDGPYTKAANITSPGAFNINSSVYIHPNIKYSAPQNIVYFNSINPSPNPADNVVGTPYSDFSRATLAAAGSSNGSPGPGGRYLTSGWVSGSSASPSPLDPTEYYEFKMEPKDGYYFNFTDMKFSVLRGNTVQPNTFALRSSIDGFSSNIGTPVTITGTTTPQLITFNATSGIPAGAMAETTSLNNVAQPITFRLYAYGSTGSGSQLVGLNDFQFNGQVLQLQQAMPVNFSTLLAQYQDGLLTVNWGTFSEKNNSYFEIQTSKDGKNFNTIKKIFSKNGNSDVLQNYEAAVTTAEMAGLMALPLLIGLLSFAGNKKYKIAMWLMAVITITAAITSCNKYNDALLNKNDKLYIRIKQVDHDGKASYSKVITVINKN